MASEEASSAAPGSPVSRQLEMMEMVGGRVSNSLCEGCGMEERYGALLPQGSS